MLRTLTWERQHPYYLGGLAFVASYLMRYTDIVLPKDASFFSAVITLGGIFAAFSVTIKSLILSNSQKVESLQDSGYYDIFMRYLATSIDASLVLCAIGLLGFIKPLSEVAIFTPLTIGMFAFSLLSLRRVTMASTAVLKQRKRRLAG